MEKIKYSDIINNVENGKLLPHNFYNLDISYDAIASSEYYISHKDDRIDKPQILHKMFWDIEVYNYKKNEFPSPEIAEAPISANTMYYSKDKTYYCYLWPPENFDMSEKELTDYLESQSKTPQKIGVNTDGSDKFDTYLDNDQHIVVKFFNDPYQLTIDSWELNKKQDPSILSSFNGHTFDLPYMYNYLLHHFNEDNFKVSNVMSKFGKVSLDNAKDRSGRPYKQVKIIECPHMDMLYAYLPREDGGLGLGQKRKSYKLHDIAFDELGLTKYEYASEGLTLDEFYEVDFKNYSLYNLWDVALLVKLDKKLGLIDIQNLQRKKMFTSFSPSLRGSSPVYE